MQSSRPLVKKRQRELPNRKMDWMREGWVKDWDVTWGRLAPPAWMIDYSISLSFLWERWKPAAESSFFFTISDFLSFFLCFFLSFFFFYQSSVMVDFPCWWIMGFGELIVRNNSEFWLCRQWFDAPFVSIARSGFMITTERCLRTKNEAISR